MTRDIEAYLKLPYHRVWEWREDDAEPYRVVPLAEIPEVVGDGATSGRARYPRARRADGDPLTLEAHDASG